MTASTDQYTDVWKTQTTELQAVYDELSHAHSALISQPTHQHPDIRRHQDGTIAGSVNLLDALYLYALVRHFKPKVIFEVGTWTGMSARFMAEAIRANGYGHIYTCDIHSYYLLGNDYDSEITRINRHSADALDSLPNETVIDMVFLDGDIDSRTTSLLLSHLGEHAIIATHDFQFPGEKGVRNLVGIQLQSNHAYTYVRPGIPKWLQEKTGLQSTSISFLAQGANNTLMQRIVTSWYALTLFVGAVYRRLRRLFRV